MIAKCLISLLSRHKKAGQELSENVQALIAVVDLALLAGVVWMIASYVKF